MVNSYGLVNDTYAVRTYVWVRKGGQSIIITESYHNKCKWDMIPEILEFQMIMALKEKIRVEFALKNYKECKYVK